MTHSAISIFSEDGFYHFNLLDRYVKRAETRPMRVLSDLIWLFVALASLISSGFARAQAVPRATLVVFAERPMSDVQWTALSTALRREIADEPQLKAGAELLRGETMPRGLEVTNPISIYLHGECDLIVVPQPRPLGALGWVRRVHGEIEPFVHVDCGKIAQELGPVAFGMSSNRRQVVMGEAVARVIAHEWIHIATQNPGHTEDGVAKSSFGILDLLAEDDQIRNDPRLFKARWRQL
jgi:hypothetical protein